MAWPRAIKILACGKIKLMTLEEFRDWYYGIYLKSEHWLTVRLEILEAIGHKCIFNCRICGGVVQLHHNSDGYENLWNESLVPGVHLVPLCRKHHEQHHFELTPWDLEEAVKNYESIVSYGYAKKSG